MADSSDNNNNQMEYSSQLRAAIRLHEIQINSLRDHINEQEQDQLRKQADAVFLTQQMHEQMMHQEI